MDPVLSLTALCSGYIWSLVLSENIKVLVFCLYQLGTLSYDVNMYQPWDITFLWSFFVFLSNLLLTFYR